MVRTEGGGAGGVQGAGPCARRSAAPRRHVVRHELGASTLLGSVLRCSAYCKGPCKGPLNGVSSQAFRTKGQLACLPHPRPLPSVGRKSSRPSGCFPRRRGGGWGLDLGPAGREKTHRELRGGGPWLTAPGPPTLGPGQRSPGADSWVPAAGSQGVSISAPRNASP